MTSASYKAKGDDFKASVMSSIPSEWIMDASALAALGSDVSGLVQSAPLLSSVEKEIIALDATALRDAITARTYTSVAVATAYAKAAALAHQATNCLMAFFLDEALARARWLDTEMERAGPVGPMHGVPVSIKDHIQVKGQEAVMGYVSWIGQHVATEDATIVRALREAGANFIVKTSMPQGGMFLETDSFLGPTLNAHNRALTAGGSSGGEAALLACGASALGVGSDIGGSIRLPAANAGIFGFKGTSVRLPMGGFEASSAGQESILPATGPMARSARDLELLQKVVLGSRPWRTDNSVVRMPWRPAEVEWEHGGTRPRVGVMWEDGLVVPQPPMRRALKAAVDALRAQGLDVVDFKAYNMLGALETLVPLYFTDGAAHVRADLEASGEPAHPLLKESSGSSVVHEPAQLWAHVAQREGFRNEFARHWNEARIDVLLSPPGYGSAQKLGTTSYVGYTGYWNCESSPPVLPTSKQRNT
jgi:Asp-tRNA(Asn)/Glu-tRNA(Gln) amidotransferase A subunit family amidase